MDAGLTLFLPFDLSSFIFWMSSFLISGVSGESVDVFIFIEFYIENLYANSVTLIRCLQPPNWVFTTVSCISIIPPKEFEHHQS